MNYTIEVHKHRLAAWDAASSARASPLCRFTVAKGVAILETSGFDVALASPDQLPSRADIDTKHLVWRSKVIDVARTEGLNFTHGIAAKLINCYLKSRFVCGGHHAHVRVESLHPPIDALLLKGLAAINFKEHAKQWQKFQLARWSKFDSETYQAVIDLIRHSLKPDVALWKIEEYWGGHQ